MTVTLPGWLLVFIALVYATGSVLNAYAAYLDRELRKLKASSDDTPLMFYQKGLETGLRCIYTARNCVDAFGWEGAFKHATDALHDRIHCNELPAEESERWVRG